MKHTFYRSYLLFAVLVYNPGITLAIGPANPTRENSPEGVWQNILKGVDGVLPTRGSQIAVAVPSFVLLATWLLTWKFWPKANNVVLPNETSKTTPGEIEAKVREINVLNEKIEYLKNELMEKQNELNDNVGQSEKARTTAEGTINNLNKEMETLKETLETAKTELEAQKKLVEDRGKAYSTLDDQISNLNKIHQEKLDELNKTKENFENFKKISIKATKKDINLENALGNLSKKNKELLDKQKNKILKLKTKLEYVNQMQKIDNDEQVEALKEEKQNQNLIESRREGEAANTFHPHFEETGEGGGQLVRYVYEIIKTEDDNLVGYRVWMKETFLNNSIAKYENHLIIIDQAVKEACMAGGKNTAFEHICRERMFSDIEYMGITSDVCYTFLFPVLTPETNLKNVLGRIRGFFPENKKDLHTVSVDGEAIVETVLTELHETDMFSNKTDVVMVGLGEKSREWVQLEKSADLLNKYNNILNMVTDEGFTKDRILVNGDLKKPIINVAIQKVNKEVFVDEDGNYVKIDQDQPFQRFSPDGLRTRGFFVIPSLYYGIFYHNAKIDWKRMNMSPNFIYVDDPSMGGGALGIYCHTDVIYTKNTRGYDELDAKKFAERISKEFTETALFRRIASDELKRKKFVGEKHVPITRTQEIIDNGTGIIKQGVEIAKDKAIGLFSGAIKIDYKGHVKRLYNAKKWIPMPNDVYKFVTMVYDIKNKENTLEIMENSTRLENVEEFSFDRTGKQIEIKRLYPTN